VNFLFQIKRWKKISQPFYLKLRKAEEWKKCCLLWDWSYFFSLSLLPEQSDARVVLLCSY